MSTLYYSIIKCIRAGWSDHDLYYGFFKYSAEDVARAKAWAETDEGKSCIAQQDQEHVDKINPIRTIHKLRDELIQYRVRVIKAEQARDKWHEIALRTDMQLVEADFLNSEIMSQFSQRIRQLEEAHRAAEDQAVGMYEEVQDWKRAYSELLEKKARLPVPGQPYSIDREDEDPEFRMADGTMMTYSRLWQMKQGEGNDIFPTC